MFKKFSVFADKSVNKLVSHSQDHGKRRMVEKQVSECFLIIYHLIECCRLPQFGWVMHRHYLNCEKLFSSGHGENGELLNAYEAAVRIEAVIELTWIDVLRLRVCFFGRGAKTFFYHCDFHITDDCKVRHSGSGYNKTLFDQAQALAKK